MEYQLCVVTRLSTLHVSSYLILTITLYELLSHLIHKDTVDPRGYVICSRVHSKSKGRDSNPGLNGSLFNFVYSYWLGV